MTKAAQLGDVVAIRLRRTFREGFRHRIDARRERKAMLVVLRVFFTRKRPAEYGMKVRKSWHPGTLRFSAQLNLSRDRSLGTKALGACDAEEAGQLRLF